MKINGLLWAVVQEQDLKQASEEGKAREYIELTMLGIGTVDIKPRQENRLLGAQTLISPFLQGFQGLAGARGTNGERGPPGAVGPTVSTPTHTPSAKQPRNRDCTVSGSGAP